ncbi:MAG: HEPN family nuclease [Aeromonas sp.]
MYSREENQIIQTYISFKFLYELHSSGFVNSPEFKKLHFNDSYVQEQVSKNGIFTQGMIPPILYMLLVMPKEMLSDQLKNDYDCINKKVSAMSLSTTTTYLSDKKGVDYLRHLRNAVSHMNVEYISDNNVFKDSRMTKSKKNRKPRKEEFEVKISNVQLGTIVGMLDKVFIKYIENIKAHQN